MAAKLAYENPAVVKRVVKDIWKLNFVKFSECWNEQQQMVNTQAFIFTDKPKDANAVVVAFRGTEAFNAYDWSTDLDFTWVKLDRLGYVHQGFLEALGFISRKHPDTIERLNTNAIESSEATEAREQAEATATRTPVTPHRRSKEEIEKAPPISGLAQGIIDDPAKEQAYDAITKRVGLILNENPRAKLFITGHSLEAHSPPSTPRCSTTPARPRLPPRSEPSTPSASLVSATRTSSTTRTPSSRANFSASSTATMWFLESRSTTSSWLTSTSATVTISTACTTESLFRKNPTGTTASCGQ
ncbi:triacylglycerol lipase OBL1 isoform X1 [Physcomitrium patens]